jgi:hypothetical protein
MSTNGFGSAPYGTGPYGIGTPFAVPSSAGRVLEDETGRQLSGRRINPLTRQYDYASNGRAIGQTTVYQMVQLACRTDESSSAAIDLGHRLRSIRDVGDNFERQVEAVYRHALAQLVADGLIEFMGTKVERDPNFPNRTKVRVRFRDLTASNDSAPEQEIEIA